MNKEYVIWGIPRNGKEEVLLLTSVQGKKIVSRDNANRLMMVLEDIHDCTACRIQEIDLENNKIDFYQYNEQEQDEITERENEINTI